MLQPTVLLIIDLQKGFVTGNSRHIVAPIERMQHKFDHVIATKFYNPDPSPFREILDYQKLSPDDSETQFAFTPRGDAHIIERPLYTCVNELFKGHIRQLNIKEIYVCGIATEACVLKTVLDLFEINIRSWLITDLCASDQEDKYHEIALELIGKLINTTHLIDSRQVLQTLNAK